MGDVSSGGLEWVLVVNLIIWTGLFLYMLRLGRLARRLEQDEGDKK